MLNTRRLFTRSPVQRGKNYGGQVDVQTVFDQAILVLTIPASKNFKYFPPPKRPTPSSSGGSRGYLMQQTSF